MLAVLDVCRLTGPTSCPAQSGLTNYTPSSLPELHTPQQRRVPHGTGPGKHTQALVNVQVSHNVTSIALDDTLSLATQKQSPTAVQVNLNITINRKQSEPGEQTQSVINVQIKHNITSIALDDTLNLVHRCVQVYHNITHDENKTQSENKKEVNSNYPPPVPFFLTRG